MVDELPVVRPEHLIPLKAKAWLDLTARSENGEPVDSKDIRKHRNDVFRMYAIIDPDYVAQLPTSIRQDVARFVEEMRHEEVDLKTLGLGGMSLDSVLDSILQRYAT